MVTLKKSDDSNNNGESNLELDDMGGKKTFMTKFFGFIFELIKTVLISLAIILPIRYFVIQPFYVNGASMEPNFHDNDYLIINELVYRFSEPDRGDIVVFKNPRNKQEFFIKRIIALPGEKIKIYNNQIFIYNKENPDGILLTEEYLPEGRITRGNEVIELGENEYYVLGDNRERSLDSRIFGPIEKELITGKVWVRGWPLDRMTLYKEVEYNF